MPRKERFRNVGAGKGIKQQLDASTLRKLYHDEGLTQAEIGRRYACTRQFISLLLREYGIPRSPTRKRDEPDDT